MGMREIRPQPDRHRLRRMLASRFPPARWVGELWVNFLIWRDNRRRKKDGLPF